MSEQMAATLCKVKEKNPEEYLSVYYFFNFTFPVYRTMSSSFAVLLLFLVLSTSPCGFVNIFFPLVVCNKRHLWWQ
jgi:hypothetical protein